MTKAPRKKPADAARPLAIEYRDLRKLVPYARNAKLHPPEQIAQIKALLLDLGWANAIKVAGEGILAGHGTAIAALELAQAGQPIPGNADPWMAPCIDLAHLSRDKQRVYIVADNKVAMNAGWDEALLRMELIELRDLGVDVTLAGFGTVELESIFGIAGADREMPVGNLADRFGLPPFSVLDARSGWWQGRKRAWLALGIKSEVGRGANLLKMSDQVLDAQNGGDPYGKRGGPGNGHGFVQPGGGMTAGLAAKNAKGKRARPAADAA